MPINPMALQVQMPEIQSPANAMAKGLTLQNAMLKQQQMRDEMEQTKQMRRTDAAIQQYLAGGGSPDDLPKLFGPYGADAQKKIYESRNLGLTGEKTRSELIDAAIKRDQEMLWAASDVAGLHEWVDFHHNDPFIGPFLTQKGRTAEMAHRDVDQMVQVNGFEKAKALMAYGQRNFYGADKPEYASRNLGNLEITEQRSGLGLEPPKIVGAFDVGISPYQQAYLDSQRAQQAVSSRAQQQRPSLTDVVDPTNPAQSLKVDANVYQGGGVGSPGVLGVSGKTPGTPEALDVKEQVARDKAYPKARSAYNAAQNEIDTQIKDLKTLASHPGLDSATGGIEGRLPSVRGKTTGFDALLDKVLSRGQFRELQNLRNNSPTGGALGNVSDAENRALRSAFAALDKKQDSATFRRAVQDAVSQLEFSSQNLMRAYDDTYAYRSSGTVRGQAAPTGPSAAPAGVDQVDWDMMTPEEQALWQK